MIFLDKSFKKLIIFFSKDGNTRFLSFCISKSIEADLLEIKVQNEDSFFKKVEKIKKNKFLNIINTPELIYNNIDIEKYDLIFIGSPIWHGKIAKPIENFIKQNKITGKQIALFCCYSKKAGRAFYKISKLLKGNEIVGLIGFQEPMMFKESRDIMSKKATDWAADITNDVRKKLSSSN